MRINEIHILRNQVSTDSFERWQWQDGAIELESGELKFEPVAQSQGEDGDGVCEIFILGGSLEFGKTLVISQVCNTLVSQNDMADHGSNMVPSLRLDTNTQLPTNVFQYETHFTNNLIEDRISPSHETWPFASVKSFQAHWFTRFARLPRFASDSLQIPFPGVHASGEPPSGPRDQFRLVQAEPLAKTSTTEGQPQQAQQAQQA